jgi:hypothetical protein
MKRVLIIIVCLISFIQITNAQNFVHEFGKFSDEEFRLKQYAKDPSAEAVVIYDIGKSYFTRDDDGFKVIFERTMKIKIFNKAGIKWAQISIPYYEEGRECETIMELKGNTYNFENGQVRRSALDPKNAFNEKFNEHWYDKKFAMPDVKEGSVIEVSYQIKSPFIFNFRGWKFQNEIPVIFSEYTVNMIPFYEYTNMLQGASKFDGFRSYETVSTTSPLGTIVYKDLAYCYTMKDLPAFKDESFITSAEDYIVKLDFQLSVIHRPDGSKQSVITTWPKLCEEMMDNGWFGKYVNSCKRRGKEITDTMQMASKSTLEKAKSIEHFVKSNFNWNGYRDKYATKSIKEFLTTKTGNCADINLFLTGMLNSVGIEAYPVIISTRSNGKIKLDYPFSHFFNYVIVLAKIDGLPVLLDATESLSNFSEIPSRCINDKGLIIQKDKTEWIETKSSTTSDITYNIDIRLNADKDSVYQRIGLITKGYEAIEYRSNFLTSYKDLKVKLLGSNFLPGDSLKPVDLRQIEKPFEINFNVTIPIETVEDKIIISPFSNYTMTENPLKQLVRNYPIDLIYRESHNFRTTIAKPVGYTLFSKPEDVVINNENVKISYAVDMQNKDEIIITGVYELKKDVYASSEYLEIKGYFNRIVNKFNEKLVFVKDAVKI